MIVSVASTSNARHEELEGTPTTASCISATDGVASAWTRLERSATSPMQHFIWSAACDASFKEAGQVQLAVIGDARACTAIAPLVRTKGPVPRLESIGFRQLFEPMDFLWESPAALRSLAEHLARQNLPLRLPRVPAESPVIPALQEAFKGRGLVYVNPTNPTPYIALDPSWAQPENRFNSGRRSDFRRALRNAEKLGKVTFEILSPAARDVDRLLDEAIVVEGLSWKRERGSALACDTMRRDFFREYARAACEKGVLRLVFMRIDGRAVGMQVAIESNRRFWLLKIGHDESISRCSPGTLLMLHTLKYAATRGLEAYEFLGEAAPWTATWTSTLRQFVIVRAYPVSGVSLAALAADFAGWTKGRIRRWREQTSEKAPA